MFGESGTGTSRTYRYYKCARAKKGKLCDKKAVRKEWMEEIAIQKALGILENAELVNLLVDKLYALQGEENPRLPRLNEQMADIEKRIENMLSAIEQGIITDSTKDRLSQLEAKKKEIEITILQEKIKKPFLTKEQILFGIEKYKKLDLTTQEGKQRLIDGFINAIYVYDDRITFTYNYKDGTETITLSELESAKSSDIKCIGAPKNGTVIRLSRFFASSSCSNSCIFRSSRAEAGALLFFLPLTPSPPTMPSSACAKIISYGAPKMRSGSSPGRIFCTVKLFELLHFQEFARGGGRAPFLSSSHPLPADNTAGRLNKKPLRSSRFLGKWTRERVAKAPDFCYHICKRSGRKRRPYLSRMASLLLALIYLAFISLGLPDSLLGSGWPVIHVELNVPVSYMGIVTMIISGCTIISSLLADRLIHKFGTACVTVVSVFLTAVALIGFSFCTKFWMLLILAVPYGLGAGAIDAALNNYVALHYSSRHMSWLHCFWGVGTIVSPFVMSYALTNATWNRGYLIVGILQTVIAVILLATIPVWKKTGHESLQSTQQKSIGLIGALKIRGVPFLLIGFLCYCAAEATAMSWSSTYFVEVKGIGEAQAAQFASLFYIGLTAGRFISGFIAGKLGDRKMIILGTCIAAAGIVVLFLPFDVPALALAAFIVVGLGCAPIYPSIIHSTPFNFGAEHSGAIIGIQMASAYVGSTFMPPLFGLLGRHIGFAFMPIWLAAFLAVMIVMMETTFRITTKAHAKESC